MLPKLVVELSDRLIKSSKMKYVLNYSYIFSLILSTFKIWKNQFWDQYFLWGLHALNYLEATNQAQTKVIHKFFFRI